MTGIVLYLQLGFSAAIYKSNTVMDGPLLYIWLLCLAPAFVWSINMIYDTRGSRNAFQKVYLMCVGMSIIWSLLTPWIMGAAFWGNFCTEIYIDGKSGKT